METNIARGTAARHSLRFFSDDKMNDTSQTDGTGPGSDPAPGSKPGVGRHPAGDDFSIPVTVSAAAAQGLAPLYQARKLMPRQTRPVSLADWDRKNAQASAFIGPLNEAVARRLEVAISAISLGRVPAIRIRPRNHAPDGRLLVYLHGGGYALFSAATVLAVPSLLATATGIEVVSVDYTLAPRGNWRMVTDQVLAVWRALLDAGVRADATALFGDSAGGGLAAGTVLKMRDEGLPLPAALYLLSPWSDLAEGGDSYDTLAASDPSLEAESLSWAAAAYADVGDHRHPYVSPVYGDYSRPYPPTLIQVGTREIFLSHAVRLYQAIHAGGHPAILDVYEGMPHVHQGLIPDAPESRTAIARAAEFIDTHLARADGARAPQEPDLGRTAVHV